MSVSSTIFKSEVPGLDWLLRDGFKLPPSSKPKDKLGLVLLVRGKPGTGKTTLALQISDASLNWKFNESDSDLSYLTKYYTLDQDKNDIAAKLNKIRREKSIGKVARKDKFSISSFIRTDHVMSEMEKPLNDTSLPIDSALRVVNDIEKLMETKKYLNLTVVDGLNSLGKMDRREIIEIGYLIQLLRKTSGVSILVYEPMEHEDISVEYLVDMVIDLKGEVEAGPINYFFRSMSVTKSRYQATGQGWHKYKIRDHGIEVYPSIHFHVQRKDYMEDQFRQSQRPMSKRRQKEVKPVVISGYSEKKKELTKEAIITRILGNIKRGSSTVLFGARRTSKSQLTMDFLRAGGQKEKHCLLLSLIDNQDTIIQEAACQRPSCPNYKKKKEESCRDCFKKVFLFFLRPGCISPDEFFHYLKKRLDFAKDRGENIRRLVFWDLTQLEYRFPLLSDDPMFMPAFMDFLKQYKDEPLEFSKEEFTGQLPAEKLREAIERDKYKFGLSHFTETIKWLNEILKVSDLSKRIISKHNNLKQKKYIMELSEKLDIINRPFEELNTKDQQTLKRLNRRLLEEVYQVTPQKIGITSLFMAAANTKLSAATSAMADNVIFCWRDRMKSDINDEKIPKMIKTKFKGIKDFLVIYVDRAEGVIETKKRNLFCFPIVPDNSPMKDKSPLHDFLLPVEPFGTEEIDWLKEASDELDRISSLQGLPR